MENRGIDIVIGSIVFSPNHSSNGVDGTLAGLDTLDTLDTLDENGFLRHFKPFKHYKLAHIQKVVIASSEEKCQKNAPKHRKGKRTKRSH